MHLVINNIADKPKKDIYNFIGNFSRMSETGVSTVKMKNIIKHFLFIFKGGSRKFKC